MAEPSEAINVVLWLIVAGLSTLPLIIFSISYIRVRKTRMLIAAVAFSLFLVKGIILAIKYFVNNYSDEIWWSIVAILDMSIICLIILSLSKKE
jgi:hypothetical protein